MGPLLPLSVSFLPSLKWEEGRGGSGEDKKASEKMCKLPVGSRAEMGWVSQGWAIRWREMQREQNKINHTHTHTQLRVPPQSLSCFLEQRQGRGAEGCRSLASRPLPLGCILQPRVITSKRLPGCGGADLYCFRFFALKFVSLPWGLWPRGKAWRGASALLSRAHCSRPASASSQQQR